MAGLTRKVRMRINAPLPVEPYMSKERARELLEMKSMDVVKTDISISGAPVFREPNGQRVVMPQKFRSGTKRTLAQRELDLAQEARLYLKGMTYQEIANEISANRDYEMSHGMVASDIKLIYVRWQESYLSDMNLIKLRELARIDALELEYWDAWERSKRDSRYVEIDNTTDSQGSAGKELKPTYSRQKTKSKKSTRDGDTKYLEGIQWCVDQRCKIFGLYAPKSVNVNWRKQAEAAGVNPDEVVDGLVEQFLEAATAKPLD